MARRLGMLRCLLNDYHVFHWHIWTAAVAETVREDVVNGTA
jgi:hypothetical protein